MFNSNNYKNYVKIIHVAFQICKLLTLMYGLITNGDSVIPMKMLAATVTLSHSVVPIID